MVNPDDLRDIPATTDLPTPLTHGLPAELRDAIAHHLTALGYTQTGTPTRRWTPPRVGEPHPMNPGTWEEVEDGD